MTQQYFSGLCPIGKPVAPVSKHQAANRGGIHVLAPAKARDVNRIHVPGHELTSSIIPDEMRYRGAKHDIVRTGAVPEQTTQNVVLVEILCLLKYQAVYVVFRRKRILQ